MNNLTSIADELNTLKERHLLRSLRTLPMSGGKVSINDSEYLNFSSNDYLDLANNTRLKTAVKRALEEFGSGATASRLMSGNLPIHEECEKAVADLCAQETALLFPSGYQANVGVMTSLGRDGDIIFSDTLNHASIIDGCRLSSAKVQVYPHIDMEALEQMLHDAIGYRRRVIVSDAVFSMDGDVADVRRLRELADRFDALLVIDEAHAIGVFGKGSGVCAQEDVHADVIVGTLSKALGSQGGFVACSEMLREHILNHARSFIYSTGISPMCAAAAKEAIKVIFENPSWGHELLLRAKHFSNLLHDGGLSTANATTPIIPIPVGDDALVIQLAESLFDAGLIVVGIRPPTVPAGKARLRLSLTLAHSDEDIQRAAEILHHKIMCGAHVS